MSPLGEFGEVLELGHNGTQEQRVGQAGLWGGDLGLFSKRTVGQIGASLKHRTWSPLSKGIIAKRYLRGLCLGQPAGGAGKESSQEGRF